METKKFTKMQTCGNDYLYFNCFENELKEPEALTVKLSDRHFGIGSTGLVMILPSEVADAKMRMFNHDGSEGKMCGNSIRCVGKYLYDNNLVKSTTMTIETLSGIKTLFLTLENREITSVKVDMGTVVLESVNIPVNISGSFVIDRPVTIGESDYNITCVSMGNPHVVVFCDDVKKIELEKVGPIFENHEMFPDKVNTEFVSVIARNHLDMRVWERGNGETLACGTGACAAAVAAVLNGYCDMDKDIRVELLGGELIINYTKNAVFMTGDCQKVFEGVISI